MKFTKTEIQNVIIIEPDISQDERGYFAEIFREDLLQEQISYKVNFCQENESMSAKGVLRGLHYQLPPYQQSKLVRVVSGKVLDVAVDIREGSVTFGKYVAVELSQENHKQFFIPRGFAHGFMALEDDTMLVYKVDNYYSQPHERCIIYDDKLFNIKWPRLDKEVIISAKDSEAPYYKHE